jgi:molybdopterin-synthase adenylyltransferase
MLVRMRVERFSRQSAYAKIGPEGQERLARGRAVVIGLGGLGTVISHELLRSGLGFIRLVDRDRVEESNLPRQMLYDEADLREGGPKAIAAAARLRSIDSEAEIEAVVAELTSANVESLIADVDVVLDGTDNFETRYIVNEACHGLALPWVYGGAVMDMGSTMNILPGKGPCLRCLLRDMPPSRSSLTCATVGVLNMATGVVGSIQAAEALKIILGSDDVRTSYLSFSLWDFSFQELDLAADPDCPTCGRGALQRSSRL